MKRIIWTLLVLLTCANSFGFRLVSLDCADTLKEDYGGLLAQVLQSNMVVQQGKPFTLWGNAPAGAFVKVKADWTKEKSVVAGSEGVWKLQIDVPLVQPGDFTAHTVLVSCGNEEKKLENILLGEVWFLSGQSNMSMSMKPFLPWHKGVLNYETEIEKADYPYIRLYKQDKASADMPQCISSGIWEACTSRSVADFSGVAYYFGRKIFKETNIPVGIVLSALGGMSCQSFTPVETLKSDKVLCEKFWDTYIADPQMSAAKRPSHLYNGMIHPFIHLSIKGFGWYQGESNAGHRELYTLLNSQMIKAWRDRFNQGELPFYFVQMTPYSWKSKNFYGGGYALFREAQERILDITSNTDMVSTMDVGEINTIHPSDKKTVGERLAALALHYDYKKEGTYKGPIYKNMKIKGNKVVVSFDPETIGAGLNTKDGKSPQHFYLAGSDKIFYKAEAEIKGNVVELTSDKVTVPVAVRYAFLTYPITNFQNKDGYAAYPFRTDTWKNAQYGDGKK